MTGTCGVGNAEFVRELVPSAEVLDYASVDLEAWVAEDAAGRRFDVVVDCVGGKTLEGVWKVAKSGGVVISVAQPADAAKPVQGVQEECGVAGSLSSRMSRSSRPLRTWSRGSRAWTGRQCLGAGGLSSGVDEGFWGPR